MQVNYNIEAITESTLIVGVDIAKKKHIARACNYRGSELGSKLQFENNINGFLKFRNWIDEIKLKNCKQQLIIGMEPTGHYWFNLYDYIEGNFTDAKAVLVETYVSKYTRKLYGNVKRKTDDIDAHAIAMSIKDGRFFKRLERDEIYLELNQLMRFEEKHVKLRNQAKNNIIRILDIYFPEYVEVFRDPTKKISMEILKNCQMPQDILRLTDDQIKKIAKSVSRNGISLIKVRELKEAAKKSIGRVKCTGAGAIELLTWLELLEQYEKNTERIMKRIEELIKTIKWADNLLKIKGIALKTVATIAAEAGDITKYKDGKQLVALSGLNLIESSSGTHEGETTISKRGNRRLRKVLYMAMLVIKSNQPEFKELHEYYITRKDNPLKKKQSVIALCCKLLRVIYGMAKNNCEYNPMEIFKSIKYRKCSNVA